MKCPICGCEHLLKKKKYSKSYYYFIDKNGQKEINVPVNTDFVEIQYSCINCDFVVKKTITTQDEDVE